jgi:hypothetical protein
MTSLRQTSRSYPEIIFRDTGDKDSVIAKIEKLLVGKAKLEASLSK